MASRLIVRSSRTEPREAVIDATDHVVGRLASVVAKRLLQGQRITIVNAEKAVFKGNERSIKEHYLMLARRKQLSSHKKITVWYPRRPETLLKSSITRMLPKKKPRGRNAAKRLRVYTGVPNQYTSRELQTIEKAQSRGATSSSGKILKTMTLGDLARDMGWTKL
ncbi:MAG: 50S ribosomal protein L13 [Aigarchaeota archaeon]|nr:50S ribosomal protein L13 [Aigarchaeota archaeon]